MKVRMRSGGTSGLKVSRICLGMMSYGDPAYRAWLLDEDAAEPIVRRAVEAGITFFDTADMYSDGAQRGDHRRLLGQAASRAATTTCSRPRSTTR